MAIHNPFPSPMSGTSCWCVWAGSAVVWARKSKVSKSLFSLSFDHAAVAWASMLTHCKQCNYVIYITVQRIKSNTIKRTILFHGRVLLIYRNATIADLLDVLVTSKRIRTIITQRTDNISIELLAVNSVERIWQNFVNHRVAVHGFFLQLLNCISWRYFRNYFIWLTATRWIVGAKYLLDKRDKVSPTNNTHWFDSLSRSTGCQSPVTQSYISKPAVDARGINVMRPTSTI